MLKRKIISLGMKIFLFEPSRLEVRDGHGKKSIRVFFFTFFQRNRGIIISRGDIEIPNIFLENLEIF